MPVEADVQKGLATLAATHHLDALAEANLATILQEVATDAHAPTTVRAPARVLERHLADSLVALGISEVADARRLADIGSGAGFPGLPLAVALPAARVALVESNRRKCVFLRRMCVALEASNVEVVCSRVEEWADGMEACDVALARALAPQPVVLEYAAPLLELDGVLVDWRGAIPETESQAAATAARVLGLTLAACQAARPFAEASDLTLYVFQKVRATPELFPRRPGLALKKPLGYERSA
jgi:16S rRNA (guanine527-N7)-methyltransferase